MRELNIKISEDVLYPFKVEKWIINLSSLNHKNSLKNIILNKYKFNILD